MPEVGILRAFMEVSMVPWPGNTGLFLWAPYSRRFANQGFNRIEAGDLVIHYRTTKSDLYPGMFVGKSFVRGKPVIVKSDEFFDVLRRFDLVGPRYQEYFERILRRSKKVYYVELSDFIEFEQKLHYSRLAEVSRTIWDRIRPRQNEYLKEIDKEVVEIILDLVE